MAILPCRAEGLSFRADGKPLLGPLDLELDDGGTTVILGHNGAGKSLLLNLLHGLMPPSAGHVRWLGPDGADNRRRQAMVFQKPVMLRRSVLANVEYGLKLRGVARAERRRRAAIVLQRTGLADIAERQARALSGGEQQRLALARTWVLEPEILFLDEPTASLDPGAIAAVEAIVTEIRDGGTKIVMTTHDMGQARRLADEVIFLARGQVAERGPAGAFFAGPASDPAQAFLEGRLAW
ncbi:ATP-binding cassette domain-containing protein [Oceanibacterium hippocampi]|uniref:Glycine betaine transport ATP-binding protein OpuAA n=1 Tax=Oceanibacterium hippocampi TaxID=745714 RepID=A0A1Y5TFC1_9PROT|nr:ATP-binding cassette domain-containing protein [Oceanibacterium hippocampi]SLN60591.1 Glycine betaine transport ATP-binding protein OpuAA [Oceanibacterium hippocampi]